MNYGSFSSIISWYFFASWNVDGFPTAYTHNNATKRGQHAIEDKQIQINRNCIIQTMISMEKIPSMKQTHLLLISRVILRKENEEIIEYHEERCFEWRWLLLRLPLLKRNCKQQWKINRKLLLNWLIDDIFDLHELINWYNFLLDSVSIQSLSRSSCQVAS